MTKKKIVNTNNKTDKKTKKSGCINIAIVSAGYNGKHWSI